MHIYEIYAHEFGNNSGTTKIAAPNGGAALEAFMRTKEGEGILERATGLELRIFKSNQGVVLSSDFEPPRAPECMGQAAEPVPPPPATEPAKVEIPKESPFTATFYWTPDGPVKKRKPKRKKK